RLRTDIVSRDEVHLRTNVIIVPRIDAVSSSWSRRNAAASRTWSRIKIIRRFVQPESVILGQQVQTRQQLGGTARADIMEILHSEEIHKSEKLVFGRIKLIVRFVL